MDRRDFLSPRQLAAGAGQLLTAADELRDAALQPVPTPQTFPLLSFSRRAMATIFEVMIPFGTPDALFAAEEALDEIDRLEAQLTVYRDTSEVSRLNRAAPHAAIPVEEGLFELLRTAARIGVESEGAFDVTAGALIKLWGFYRGPRRVPSETERAAVLERVGMRHVVLDPEARSVRYLRTGLEINLGSIGKGYALDRAATILRQRQNLPGALLHGGHSSVYAIGTEPGDERGWAVSLSHPWEPDRRIAMLRLRDRALGTSAATFRHLEHEGRKLSHVLDPRTGWPAEGIALASAIAPTAAEADALATVFYVRGVDWTRTYCAAHPDIGAVLLAEGEAAPTLLGIADSPRIAIRGVGLGSNSL
jgi:thiamine biosynthesis lipoprotein